MTSDPEIQLGNLRKVYKWYMGKLTGVGDISEAD
jgi:hypothetical protein